MSASDYFVFVSSARDIGRRSPSAKICLWTLDLEPQVKTTGRSPVEVMAQTIPCKRHSEMSPVAQTRNVTPEAER